MDTIKALFIKINNDMQKWFYTNSVLINASGYTIGVSTYNYITNCITLIITPLFAYIISNININKFLKLNKNKLLYKVLVSLTKLLSITLGWLFTLFLTFLLLEYILNNKIIGLKSNVKETEKKDFIISKISAKNNNTIKIEAENIKFIDEKEKIIGNKIVKKEEDILASVDENNIKDKKIEELLNYDLSYNNIVSNIID
tara:strand:+ start:634 stop:1233 length:600 start_codon:yes stop_codon:yes gene_type:complete